MTIEEMKDYFSHRELGLQEAAGEYAILVPLVQWEGQRCLLFETRADTLVGHQPGEVCFPGGRREHGETPRETALRETWEEIGIPPEEIRVLAPLDLMQDISDRVVYPFLAEISAAGAARLKASAAEVKNVFFVPVDYLLNCKEEVYRYVVSAKVDDDFPYERIRFPQDLPLAKGLYERAHLRVSGAFHLGHDRAHGPLVLAAAAPDGAAGGKGVTSVEYLGKYQLTQSDACFKLGRDSVLLAGFCTLRPKWTVCDLGCGVGSLLLLTAQREENLTRVGIELDPTAAELARKNLADNALSGTILTGDLRDKSLLRGDQFHLVLSNPPYFRAGSGRSGGQARMDDTCSVEDLCRTAGRLTRTGGRFALVYRPERLAELFAALQKARLEPKRVQLLSYHRTKAPYAVLVEAVKEGGPGLDILPTHYQTEDRLT